jgi:Activator of Hsp90 ATPase homolog 1-like protein
MSSQNFATALVLNETPEVVYAAISNVRGWWSGDIEGNTDQIGEEFTYRYRDIHYSKQRITALVPGRKLVWYIVDAYLDFTQDPNEWIGTEITFEIARHGNHTEVSFAHVGLVPESECFDKCSYAWGFYVNNSLRRLITTGTGAPNPEAA